MPILDAPPDFTPGAAFAEFLSKFTELWNPRQLAQVGQVPGDVFDNMGDILDVRFSCMPDASKFTWEPTGQNTPRNNPVLSQDTLIGKLLVSIRGDNRALMLNVSKLSELGITALDGGRYVLTVGLNLIEINGRVLWSRSAM